MKRIPRIFDGLRPRKDTEEILWIDPTPESLSASGLGLSLKAVRNFRKGEMVTTNDLQHVNCRCATITI